MKKITLFCKIGLLLGSTVISMVQAEAHADTVTDSKNEIRITEQMPRSGGVILDDSGKVIGTTDPSLITDAPLECRGSVHIHRGHWTYGTHSWPRVAWGTKQAWSNFNHYDKFHYATAVVGGRRYTAYADRNMYAYATVVGDSKHTGLAYYGW
ncbi:hypothetical protein ACFDBZ_11035 [Enterococcus lactis]|nr:MULTISPECIES: hypothetical protein [Enterococcus]MDG4615938.1 hypothetical protein [Enterococcus lactis]MDV4764523.1 lactococcin 972 family bacteriocin [Enterococcus faecium]MEB4751450.1 hypothetical protein [Enterococcus sp. E5-162]